MGLQLHKIMLSEDEIVTAMCGLNRQIKFLEDTGEQSRGVLDELKQARDLKTKLSGTGV